MDPQARDREPGAGRGDEDALRTRRRGPERGGELRGDEDAQQGQQRQQVAQAEGHPEPAHGDREKERERHGQEAPEGRALAQGDECRGEEREEAHRHLHGEGDREEVPRAARQEVAEQIDAAAELVGRADIEESLEVRRIADALEAAPLDERERSTVGEPQHAGAEPEHDGPRSRGARRARREAAPGERRGNPGHEGDPYDRGREPEPDDRHEQDRRELRDARETDAQADEREA